MSGFPPNEMDIDQAIFGWSNEAGKLALLDSSFERDSQKKQWLGRLEAFARLKSLGDEPLPAEALSYFQFDDGSAAILHRVNKGPSGARNNSHALIGPAVALNELVALGLAVWEEWEWLEELPRGGRLSRYEAGSFASFAATAEKTFRPLASEIERELTVVLALLLDNPSAPLSILGCADKDRLTLVWGLRAAADDYLRSQLRQVRSWSFSTYEHRVNVEGLPEIVFLPTRPAGAAPVRRAVVDLDRYGQPSGPNAEQAVHLVARLLRGTPLPAAEHDGVTKEIPVGGTVYGPPFEKHPGPPLVSARHGQSSHVPAVEHGHRPQGPVELPPVNNGVPNQPVPPTPDPRPNPADELPDLVALRNARDLEDFMAALRRLERSSNESYREQLRRGLTVSAIDNIAMSVQDMADNILDRLTKILFGPNQEDLSRPQGLEFAAWLARSTRSDRLARMVMSAIPEERWRMGNQAPEPTSPWGKRVALAVRRNPQQAAIGFGVAVTALAVVFLLGGENGEESVRSPAAVVDNQTSQSVDGQNSTNSGSASPPLQVAGVTFMAPPQSEQQLFFFMKVGESYYPQGPCDYVGGQSGQEWSCKPVYEAPGSTGRASQPVAVQVPVRDVEGLTTKAQQREPRTELEKDWKLVPSS